jgi:hypothetical protein
VEGLAAFMPAPLGGAGQTGPEQDRSPVLTPPRTAAEVISDHVLFEAESIDRMLHVYQPWLQVVDLFGAADAPRLGVDEAITDAFVGSIHHHVAAHDLELVVDRGP